MTSDFSATNLNQKYSILDVLHPISLKLINTIKTNEFEDLKYSNVFHDFGLDIFTHFYNITKFIIKMKLYF